MGRRAHRPGEIACAPLLPHAAVALSRGKFPKGYPHLDPNEDARAALTALQGTAAATLTRSATDPEVALRTALTLAGAAVTDALTDVEEGRSASATALTAC